MNDIDLDIILAIADERLTGQEKQDALERIAADPELGEELASQISAMDDLKSLEPALMTAEERTALRASLVEQLHLSPAAPAVASKPQRRPWWQPVLGLASAAALLIAIVAVPSMFSGSDDSSADIVAVESVATSSAAEPVATTSAASSGELDDGDVSSSATRDAAADTSPSTIVVPVITAEVAQEFFAAAPSPIDTTVATVSDDAAASGAADEPADDSALTDSQSFDLVSTSDPITVDAVHLENCLATLIDDLPEGTHVPVAATLDDAGTVIHFGIDAGDGVTYSVSIDLETCTITSLNQ